MVETGQVWEKSGKKREDEFISRIDLGKSLTFEI